MKTTICPSPSCGKESTMPPKGIEDENKMVCPYCEEVFTYRYKVELTKNQKRNRRKRDKKK